MTKTKSIELKVGFGGGTVSVGMRIPQEMDVAELLELIQAKGVQDYDPMTGDILFPELGYYSEGTIKQSNLYDVSTRDSQKTLDLIKKHSVK